MPAIWPISSALPPILLQNYFEGSDTQDCVAKSTVGETMISVGVPVGSFIARAPPVQEFCNRIGGEADEIRAKDAMKPKDGHRPGHINAQALQACARRSRARIVDADVTDENQVHSLRPVQR